MVKETARIDQKTSKRSRDSPFAVPPHRALSWKPCTILELLQTCAPTRLMIAVLELLASQSALP